KRLYVFLSGLLNHIGGEAWHRRLLVPADRFEVVADELFVEALLRPAGPVQIARPEARRIGRQHFVDQNNRALLRSVHETAELELGVGDDDAAVFGVRSAAR